MESLTPAPLSRRRRALRAAARMLGEGTMGFLALVALALAVAPALLGLGPAAIFVLSTIEWAVVALFAIEYAVGLALAENRKSFLRDPWRILDLAIIVIPLLSLLPALKPLRSSPILRLIRVARVLLVGARFGGRAARRVENHGETAGEGPAEVSILREGRRGPETASWEEFLGTFDSLRGAWVHVTGLGKERIGEAARATGLPERFLAASVEETARPRLEVADGFSALFLWLPEIARERPVQLERTSVLLLTAPGFLLSFSRRRADFHGRIGAAIPRLNLPDGSPFPTRMTYAFLRFLLERYQEALKSLEEDVRRLEDVPAKGGGAGFFGESFALERELTSTRGDLWRLKGVVGSLAAGRVNVHGARQEDREFLRGVAEEAESLHESASSLRESLVSLMDLHMNVASFEMNRGMRVLAILSALGLIPAVVGGLLGMNLVGNPWPATLPQVAYGVFWGMALSLYVFFVKGWIR